MESSGRELERIVVAEIQKAYNVYVNIIQKEGRELIDVSERLTASTLNLPTDYEWNAFVARDPKMVNPNERIRIFDEIEYPGCHHPAALEVKTGTLERKSKYLKSFTPAWYVLSPTHLHEFKSQDRTRDYQPAMSLYLPDSTLGKHSDPAAVSHKFVVKAKQTGGMHRAHSWVFRAETHEIMMDWYESLKKLTEISGRERDTFVAGVVQRQRTVSSASQKKYDADSDSSEYGLDNDEADEVPYSGRVSTVAQDDEPLEPPQPIRPEGGRFPSDIDVSRYSTQQPGSVSPESSHEAVANVTALPGAQGAYAGYDQQRGYTDEDYAREQQRVIDERNAQAAYQLAAAEQQVYSQQVHDRNTYVSPEEAYNQQAQPHTAYPEQHAEYAGRGVEQYPTETPQTAGDTFIAMPIIQNDKNTNVSPLTSPSHSPD